MTAKYNMTAIVHGWCGFVEKSNEVVYKQMVLNKLWIPDDMINEIKDYLYISAVEVLRKFYRAHVNRSITDLWVNHSPLTDIYGRDRQAIYAIGHVYGGGKTQIQGTVCLTCGDFDHRHANISGCCPLQFDLEDEPIYLVENYWEQWGGGGDMEVTDETIAAINAEADVEADVEAEPEDTHPETIPEITWAVDIPVQNVDFASDEYRQAVLDNWNSLVDNEVQLSSRVPDDDWSEEHQRFYSDLESDAHDYAEYLQELRMEEYSDRR